MKKRPPAKKSDYEPRYLHHLIEFSPAETRVLSFDDHEKPWSLMLNRYHRPTAVGGVFVGIVRIVHTPGNFALLDIGEADPAFMQFSKTAPVPHVGKRLLVQCKRDRFAEKAPLMSEVQVHTRRYLKVKLTPTNSQSEEYSPAQVLPPSLQHFAQDEILQKILRYFAQAELLQHHLINYTLQWFFTPFVISLWHACEQSEPAFLSVLLFEASEILDGVLTPIAQTSIKEKGLIQQPIAIEKKLLHLMKSRDSLTIKSFSKNRTNLQEEIKNYPDLELSLKAAPHGMDDINSNEVIETILQNQHAIGSNASIRIEENLTLTAIDVDTGIGGNASIFDTNLLALAKIARLIFARNLSGIILVDPVSSVKKGQLRVLVEKLRQLMKGRHPLLSLRHCDVLGSSPSGLIELTRERIMPSISELYCPKGVLLSTRFVAEAQLAHLLYDLSKKASDNPSVMLSHQSIPLSKEAYATLQRSYGGAMRALEQQWQDIELWHEVDS